MKSKLHFYIQFKQGRKVFLFKDLTLPKFTYQVFVILFLLSLQAAYSQGRMVMYLPFSGNANDVTGNGHNGRVSGATLTTDRFGKPSSAYLFDGVNDYIQIPHSPELRADRATPITLCAWVNFCNKQTDYAGIVCKGSRGTPYPGQQLVVREGYRIEGELSTGDKQVLSIGNALARHNDGAWHFITMVVNTRSGDFSIFVDGKKEASIVSQIFDPSIDDFSSPMFIGVERNLKYFFKGIIDDIRIYNYPLLQNEIQFLFEEGNFKPSGGVRGSYRSVRICSQDATLTADSGFSRYKWSNGETTQTIRITREGIYTVEKSNSGGCNSIDTFEVKLGEMKFETEQTSPNVKCLGQKISFRVKNITGSPPYKFIWTRITNGENEILSGDSNITFVVKYPAERITLDVYDGKGCRALVTIFPVVDNPVSVNVLPSRNVSICGGGSAELKIVLSRSNAGFKYEWSPATGLNTAYGDVVRAMPQVTTLYRVKIYDPSGCEFFDSVLVKINNKMTVHYPNRNMCAGEFALLDGTVDSGAAPYKYSWQPTTYLDNPNSKSPKATPPVSSKYVCTITDANNCTATTVVQVNVSSKEVSLVQEPNNIIDLGRIEESFVRCREIKLSNATNVPITISNATFASNSHYFISSKTLPISLPPLGTKGFTICYMPLKTGNLLDTLLLDLKGSCNPTMVVISDVFFADSMGSGCDVKYLKIPKDGYKNLLRVAPPVFSNEQIKIKVAYSELLSENLNFEVYDISGNKVDVGKFDHTSETTADINASIADENYFPTNQPKAIQLSNGAVYMVNFQLGEIKIPYDGMPTEQGVYFVKISCGSLVRIVKVVK